MYFYIFEHMELKIALCYYADGGGVVFCGTDRTLTIIKFKTLGGKTVLFAIR